MKIRYLITSVLVAAAALCIGCGSADKWNMVNVPAGKFSVECPGENVIMPSEEVGFLTCNGSDAEYLVNSRKLSSSPDLSTEAINDKIVFPDTIDQLKKYKEVFSAKEITNNGRRMMEVIAREEPGSDPGKKGDKPRLLIYQNTFAAADKREFSVQVSYEMPADGNYQAVLEKNKLNRERFLNSLRIY